MTMMIAAPKAVDIPLRVDGNWDSRDRVRNANSALTYDSGFSN